MSVWWGEHVGTRAEDLTRRLEDRLLEAWEAIDPAFDAIDDGIRRIAIHMGLLQREIEGGEVDRATRRVELLQYVLSSLRHTVHRLDWLEDLDRRPGRPEEVPLARVVDTVLRNHADAIEAAGALVAVGELPRVWARPDDLEVIVDELVANALRHGASHPLALRIAAERHTPDWVVLSVADTGPGFDPEYAAAVFEPGVVLLQDSVRSGSGMGLAACRLLAERNQGRIVVRPRAGQGTTFLVTLPASRPATAA